MNLTTEYITTTLAKGASQIVTIAIPQVISIFIGLPNESLIFLGVITIFIVIPFFVYVFYKMVWDCGKFVAIIILVVVIIDLLMLYANARSMDEFSLFKIFKGAFLIT